jgi:membrane-bound serine protease (ClpP class)|uniref:Nodulation protein NfeD n=1 Tax=Desulfobacca acetoxidans TaxID=60893 RepID=A0A7V6A337_9BACT
MKRVSCRLTWLLLLMVSLVWPAGNALPAPPRAVYVLPAAGSINPGLAEFIIAGIHTAEEEKAYALVIELDTPGGLDSSMRAINQAIINATVPVIVYVSPKGARAASAGMFITLAATVAAMAPGTNIGAAHPVSVGLGRMDKVMGKKVENDAAAYARSLAEERGRNAEWAEKAVRQSVSIDAKQAQKLKVVDLVADNLEDLLQQLNGREVKVGKEMVVLKTSGVPVKTLQESLRTRILKTIADPNIAFILMMIGLAGLYFELAHPGVVLPGVLGALCLLLAFYAFQTLPVNFIGLLLIILAFILFFLEIYIISYGLLSVGGLAALILGSLMLYQKGVTGVGIAWSVLIPTVLVISLFFLAVASLVIRSQLRRAMTGKPAMVGERGVAYTDLKPEGQVFVHGEYWQAESETPVAAGDTVEVVQVVGLKLQVRPVVKGQGAGSAES